MGADEISLRDRPYTPKTWERRAGSVYHAAGKAGEPMPANPNGNKYFVYLYKCGQAAAVRAREEWLASLDARRHDIYEVGEFEVCRKCGRCGDWLCTNECDGGS
jgi:hypothetical protein